MLRALHRSSFTRATSSSSANGPHSRRPAISADGSSVVFDSSAANVVPNQTGPAGRANLFLFHRPTGRTSLVSHASSSPTTRGDGATGSFAVSADGSFVAFTSAAKNHVDRQTEGGKRFSDAFLYSRASGRITLVSGAGGSSTVTANGPSAVRGISADGNLVLFQSSATNLVQGAADGNAASDVFLYNQRSRKAALVSHGAVSSGRTGNGESLGSILSADGKWVAFQSAATDLMSGAKDFNERVDVFLDGGAAGRELASRRAADLPSATPQGWSWVESMSADGRPLRGLLQPAGNAFSSSPSLSADGRFIAFESRATNLVAGQIDPDDFETAEDVFLYDRLTGANTLVSHAPDSPLTAVGTTGPSDEYVESWMDLDLSADGRFVVFVSFSETLIGVEQEEGSEFLLQDVFLFDRETGAVTAVSQRSATRSYEPKISADGRFIAFTGDEFVGYWANPIFDGNIFLYDRVKGSSTQVSYPTSKSCAGFFPHFKYLYSGNPLLSATGHVLASTSTSCELVPRDFNGGPSDDPAFGDYMSDADAFVYVHP